MNVIDQSIEKARVKNRWIVSVSTVSGLALVGAYLIWLFLVQGYQFLILPDGIRNATVIKVEQGLASVSGHRLYTLGGEVDVTVSAEKYISQTIRVDSRSASNIEVTLQPKPAKVEITTEPEYEDIDWYVDQTPMDTGAKLEIELAKGTHVVEARHRFFKPESMELVTDAGQQVSRVLNLTPIEGSLSINTVPTPSTIKLITPTGEKRVSAPYTVTSQGGSFPVQIHKEGFEPIDDVIEITYAQPNPIRNYRLSPLKGTLNLDVNPRTSTILLDGKPVASPIRLIANTPHQIKVQAPGYQTQSRTVTVQAGEENFLSMSLSVEFGKIQVNSSTSAQVFIGGKFVGDTSQILSLQTIPTELEFRKNGYRTVTKNVVPSVNKTQVIELAMLTEFDARRKEGKPLFATSLGIELQSVNGRAFEMGSPVNEPNRQRNEHQRSVDFSRRFWVSKHEITQAQFAAFKTGVAPTSLPVTDITWHEAAMFSNWLSEKEGLIPFYIVNGDSVVGVRESAKGYRLPSEAEWEFIAKVNKRSAVTQYVWGNQDRLTDKQGNFADESMKGQQTFYLSDYQDGFVGKAPVGSYRAERGGFYDLDGNVREWVHDHYSLAPPTEDQLYLNYLGPTRGEGHVVKGASFQTGRLKNLRASRRESGVESASDIGFRIARYED